MGTGGTRGRSWKGISLSGLLSMPPGYPASHPHFTWLRAGGWKETSLIRVWSRLIMEFWPWKQTGRGRKSAGRGGVQEKRVELRRSHCLITKREDVTGIIIIITSIVFEHGGIERKGAKRKRIGNKRGSYPSLKHPGIQTHDPGASSDLQNLAYLEVCPADKPHPPYLPRDSGQRRPPPPSEAPSPPFGLLSST